MDIKSINKYFPNIQLTKDLKRNIQWLIEDYPEQLSIEQEQILKQQIQELQNSKPLAYIMGYIPFYNCNINVNQYTLIPRPETELLVDYIVKKWKDRITQNTRILDLCSGSGCIAIAIKKALNCIVDAVDIQPECCSIINQNAINNNVDINIIQSNMFTNITQQYDLIISNPPYIESKEMLTLDKSVIDYEPHIALDGGNDGLDFYKIIANNSPNFLKQNGELALEIGYKQGQQIEDLLQKDFKNIQIIKDYSKLQRFVFATKR